LRGEGWGEGPPLEFREQSLKDPNEVVADLVVPEADHAIAEIPDFAVAQSIFGAIRVLAAVEFDHEAPVAADEIYVIWPYRLPTDEFEATELPRTNASPQRHFRRRLCASQ
jgi:hypothetical protein